MSRPMKSACSGNQGERVRSDCWVKIEPQTRGEHHIVVESKVEALYGESIRRDVTEALGFFGIPHCKVTIRDRGALPWVITARMEAALNKLDLTGDNALLPKTEGEPPASRPDRMRRSRLYLPGNQPKFFLNAAIHQPDGLILDLEDSVAPDHKVDARFLVRNALMRMDFGKAERMVRINQVPLGLRDLEVILPARPQLILVPKVETPGQLKEIDDAIRDIQSASGIASTEEPYLMPIVESAKGVIDAADIACASPRNVALAIGLEDYTADMGIQRTPEGAESLFARSMLVHAARAAGIQAIDTVFSDVADTEGLRKSVLEARSIGFDGKGCIHPRQIRVINQVFLPGSREIEKARTIVLAFEEAEKEGLSVVSVGSKMIDPPVVKRAVKTIRMAEENGLLNKDWRESHDQ